MACRILVPWSGIKPAPHALEGRVLTIQSSEKSPKCLILIAQILKNRNLGSPGWWYGWTKWKQFIVSVTFVGSGGGSLVSLILSSYDPKSSNALHFSTLTPLFIWSCRRSENSPLKGCFHCNSLNFINIKFNYCDSFFLKNFSKTALQLQWNIIQEVSRFQGAHLDGHMHYLDPSTMRKAGFREQIM